MEGHLMSERGRTGDGDRMADLQKKKTKKTGLMTVSTVGLG